MLEAVVALVSVEGGVWYIEFGSIWRTGERRGGGEGRFRWAAVLEKKKNVVHVLD